MLLMQPPQKNKAHSHTEAGFSAQILMFKEDTISDTKLAAELLTLTKTTVCEAHGYYKFV